MMKITKQRLTLIIALVCMLLASACSQGAGATDGKPEETAPEAASETADDGAATSTESTTTGASTSEAATAEAPEPPPSIDDISVTLIGDSVVLGGVDAVKEAIPGIDIRARNDRQLAGPGLDTLKQEAADGELGQIVVLALGTNFVTKDDIGKAMDVIGPDRQVVFVNAYRGGADYISEVNDAISEAAADSPANFTIADWHGYVTTHPDIKLASDDCHLTKSSAADYAGVIKAGVDSAAAKIS